ncbi:hypothetical protein GCM10027348_09670 [Hymenobacter tenuis]
MRYKPGKERPCPAAAVPLGWHGCQKFSHEKQGLRLPQRQRNQAANTQAQQRETMVSGELLSTRPGWRKVVVGICRSWRR